MRFHFVSLAVLSLSFCSVAGAQSQPQFLRDYVYGPKGQVIMTAEPDTYGPEPGNINATWTHHLCSSYTAHITWSAFVDIGSGTAGYKVYQNGIYQGSTTGLSFSQTVSADTSYEYDVYGYDNAGNLGLPDDVELDVGDCLQDDLTLAGTPTISRDIRALRNPPPYDSPAALLISARLKPSIHRWYVVRKSTMKSKQGAKTILARVTDEPNSKPTSSKNAPASPKQTGPEPDASRRAATNPGGQR